MQKLISNLPLTKEQVQRFKQIVLDKKGIVLTDHEAFDQATRWLKLSKLVMLYGIKETIENKLGEVQNVK